MLNYEVLDADMAYKWMHENDHAKKWINEETMSFKEILKKNLSDYKDETSKKIQNERILFLQFDGFQKIKNLHNLFLHCYRNFDLYNEGFVLYNRLCEDMEDEIEISLQHYLSEGSKVFIGVNKNGEGFMNYCCSEYISDQLTRRFFEDSVDAAVNYINILSEL